MQCTFENCFMPCIYPPELELGKENLDSSGASFLDLDINVEDKVFVNNQYNKRDAFSFPVVRLPFLYSNMPSKIFYSSISAEILRLAEHHHLQQILFPIQKSFLIGCPNKAQI